MGRSELRLGRIFRHKKSVVRSSNEQEFRGVQNRSFGALTRKDLEALNIVRSEL
jgi:hypothetical protein